MVHNFRAARAHWRMGNAMGIAQVEMAARALNLSPWAAPCYVHILPRATVLRRLGREGGSSRLTEL